MIEIIGHALSQWDVGRSVQITGIEADHAHFANKGDSKAVIMGVVDTKAKIPDYLLQTGKQLCVYAVKDGITVESKTFYVQKRERPENYVYEDDQRNYIYELITDAEVAIDNANAAANEANRVVRELQEVEAKFAPAGYGLNNDFKTTANIADLNGYLTNGWYKYLNDAGVTLVPGFVVYYALCRVDSYSTSYVVQTLYPRAYTGCSLQRYFSNGVWSEWGWVNPPLTTNVEYRTTERYKGAAVYKKVDANGNILWRKDGESQWHLLSSADYVATATVE